MNPSVRLALVLGPVLVAGCADQPARHTLAELRNVRPDVQDVPVDQGLDKAMAGYRRFLEETPETPMTPEAMRRLADLQIEKQFGIRAGDGKPREMAAPEKGTLPFALEQGTQRLADAGKGSVPFTESDREFERRTTAADASTLPVSAAEAAGPLEAIALYDRLLAEYPNYEHNDKVLYQKARAYDELGRTEEALATMEDLIARHPHSGHFDEVQFRRGEFFFTRRRFRDAEAAYSAIVSLGASSSYYELALYKLGWTLYKQDFYEEALHRYMALLDHKVSTGYDFDASHAEDDERRVTDTFRVISLSFSNLGGPEVIREYFGDFGRRAYEDRIYANLGEYYLAKLRYDDAAKTYRAFVELYPYHRVSPRFGMRVIEIFTQGNFPKLVLESKQDFARSYALGSEYWRHHDPASAPEVLGFLKSNLKDLANHFHAQYQDPESAAQKTAHYEEARRWYGEYLSSFPTDADSPPINHQLADLLLEGRDFAEAARQYERTAYGYPVHAQSAAAGYAAIYAHRQHLAGVGEDRREAVRRETVISSIRFADAFPTHEHAAPVLGAAADDLFEMRDFEPARVVAQRVVDTYPSAPLEIRRPAWIVVAHGSFELADYGRAEGAYGHVLAALPADAPSRPEFVDHLAASIYKQGEASAAAQDFRAAAGHYLRIREVAPTSTIRPAAEYDAAAALVQLQDWAAAAAVLEAFRSAYPTHALNKEATRQVAFVYRQSGQNGRAAGEYERIAAEAEDPAMRGEALLVAGELYEQSQDVARALASYGRYVEEFPAPVETAVETRQKRAALYQAMRDEARYHAELESIVRADAEAGGARTGRTRTLAARSALVLAERTYAEFAAVRLLQPFETSLMVKQKLMTTLTGALDALVEYEIAEVTAAATFYMAETYANFSRALMDSQRPADLQAADREEYEMALEEEAFPFEEKAIRVHEKNLELLQAGVYNPWTDKSLGRLGDLMPGRYARTESSAGFLGSMESYAYRTPAARLPAPASPDAVQAPAAPASDEAAAETPVQTTDLVHQDRQEAVAHATHP